MIQGVQGCIDPVGGCTCLEEIELDYAYPLKQLKNWCNHIVSKTLKCEAEVIPYGPMPGAF